MIRASEDNDAFGLRSDGASPSRVFTFRRLVAVLHYQEFVWWTGAAPDPQKIPSWVRFPSMSTTYERILSLRAIRHYQDRPIDPDDLLRVLEAARWTGSAKNRQNWSVVVVEDRDEIVKLAECGNATKPLLAAPVALALVEQPETYEFDTGRLAQNIMLAADALGMASCPITMHRDPDAARVLGLPPGWRCRYAISLGYPAPDARPAKFGGRKPIDQLLHRGSFSS